MAAASLMFSAVALTGYKVYSYATMTDQERLMFENIEALTADEPYPGTTVHTCYNSFEFSGPEMNIYCKIDSKNIDRCSDVYTNGKPLSAPYECYKNN